MSKLLRELDAAIDLLTFDSGSAIQTGGLKILGPLSHEQFGRRGRVVKNRRNERPLETAGFVLPYERRFPGSKARKATGDTTATTICAYYNSMQMRVEFLPAFPS